MHSKSNCPGAYSTYRAISEDLLNRSGQSLITDDFDGFAACFQFPNEVETINGNRQVQTAAELKVIFDNVRVQFRRSGVNRMERHIIEASTRDDDIICCTHQSRLMNGTSLLQAPYPVFSILKRGEDAQFRIAYGTYGLPGEQSDPKELIARVLDLKSPMP